MPGVGPGGRSEPLSIMKFEKDYTADLIPKPDEFELPVEFTVIYDSESEDEAWTVSSDNGCTSRDTLDEALFWQLVLGERHISETMRERLVKELETLAGL